MNRPVFVNSIPKSGTYLLAAILEELGLDSTHWHVFETFYDDYTDVPLEIARVHPERFRIREPVERTANRLRPGQFAVGHLPYNDRTRQALRNCFVIFLKRDLRECLVSHMRWQAATGRDQSAWTRIEDPQQRVLAYLSKWGRSFIRRARSITEWAGCADRVLTFDDLHNRLAIEQLAASLDAVFDARAIRRALNAPSLTRLPFVTQEAVWSKEADRRLVAFMPSVDGTIPRRPRE